MIRKYLPLVVGLPVCLLAGWIELRRALDGHQIAWVYAVEWPFFALVGTYIWLHTWYPPSEPDEPRLHSPHSPQDEPMTTIRQGPDANGSEEPVDPALEAWQRYLARLHAADPPGEPPKR